MSLPLLVAALPTSFAHPSLVKVGNIPFEDETISFSELQAAREATPDRFPLGQMPVLTLPSGQVIAQRCRTLPLRAPPHASHTTLCFASFV
jgi:hypothetical protein